MKVRILRPEPSWWKRGSESHLGPPKARVVQRTGRRPSLPGRITSSSPLSESGGCKCEPCPGSQFSWVWCQIGGDSARNGDYAGASPVTLTLSLRCRLTSRTAGFEPVHGGANPPAAAIFRGQLIDSDDSGPYPEERRASRHAPTTSWLSGAASQRSSPIRRRSPVRIRPEPQFADKAQRETQGLGKPLNRARILCVDSLLMRSCWNQ
jgi:hypothetical protein